MRTLFRGLIPFVLALAIGCLSVSAPARADCLGQNCLWLGDIKATTSIASSTTLSSLVPTKAAASTYVVIEAIGGTLYFTYDGSTPSSSNYSGSLTAGQYYPISGAGPMSQFKMIGTNVSGNFYK